jgi:hypothetical protein
MKTKIIRITFISIMLAGLFLVNELSAQPPRPPRGPGQNDGARPIGGNAPIDGGLSIFLALGAAYGLKKTHQMKKKDKE